MLTMRTNFHHSKIPPIGLVLKLPETLKEAGRKVIVESYNLCDNVRPYSIGIHLANVRFLDNGEQATISGFWLVD